MKVSEINDMEVLEYLLGRLGYAIIYSSHEGYDVFYIVSLIRKDGMIGNLKDTDIYDGYYKKELFVERLKELLEANYGKTLPPKVLKQLCVWKLTS